jgi:hypothetical protein
MHGGTRGTNECGLHWSSTPAYSIRARPWKLHDRFGHDLGYDHGCWAVDTGPGIPHDHGYCVTIRRLNDHRYCIEYGVEHCQPVTTDVDDGRHRRRTAGALELPCMPLARWLEWCRMGCEVTGALDFGRKL